MGEDVPVHYFDEIARWRSHGADREPPLADFGAAGLGAAADFGVVIEFGDWEA